MTSTLSDGPTGSRASHAPHPTTVLRRTTQDRVLFGVAAGIARHFGVDPVLVRVAFVLLTLFGGSGVVLYLVGVVAIPQEAPGDPVGPVTSGAVPSTGVVLGVLLVVVGVLTMLDQVVPLLDRVVGPLLLVVAGVLVLLVSRR